jgi:LPXTG-site transpeptidase (sortase) family protein
MRGQSRRGCFTTIIIGILVGVLVAIATLIPRPVSVTVRPTPALTAIPADSTSASPMLVAQNQTLAPDMVSSSETPLVAPTQAVSDSDSVNITEETEPIIYATEQTATPTSTPYPIFTLTPIPDPMDIPAETYLVIPSVDVQAQIVRVYVGEGTWDVRQLGARVGYLEGTSPPGQNGNVVLAGHVELADGRKGVFATLKQVLIGAEVLVIREGKTTRYSVSSVSETTPDDLTPVQPTDDDRITLITCDDLDLTRLRYQNRIIVVAQRVD